MTRWAKILFALSLTLLVLSYPACQWGETRVHTEMAKYPADFVAAHEFDLIFVKWVLPGIWMFSSGAFFMVLAAGFWIAGLKSRRANRKSDKHENPLENHEEKQ
jgi:hypothetical protein